MKNTILPEGKFNIDEKLKSLFIRLINKESNSISNSDYNQYYNLIEENIENQQNITYIIYSISKEIFSLEQIEDKIKLLYLLKEFYVPLNTIDTNSKDFHRIFIAYIDYISRILTVIQKSIVLNIPPEKISEIFGKIINCVFERNLFEETELKRGLKAFEIFQGFCYYNMKQSSYNNQIIGVLCFKELISNTDYYIINKKFIKNINEKIILFLDNTNFEPKIILYEILSIFIKKCEKLFEPFINITLYKILNYIEDNDFEIKRKVIDVFILIISDFPYEFQNISNSIINYLNLIVKNNNDSYITNKCQEAISFYNNFNFYQTFNNFKKSEQGKNLFQTSKSSFYKTNNKKNDSLTSKSTKYTTSRKYIKDSEKKLNDYNELHKNLWKRNKNNFSYSSKFNIWKSNYNFSRAFSTNFIKSYKNKIFGLNTLEENQNNFQIYFAYSSLNKSAKRFRNNIRLKK